MQKALIFLIFLTVLAGAAVASQPVLAASLAFSGFCVGERIIYAQDVDGLTPGSDADSAFINNRNFNRLATVSQINDDYVIWPNTILVNVNAGDVLLYRALASSGSLDFDVLDSNRQLLRRAIFGSGTPNASLAINQDGFLRFNAGSRADEYNLLVLCPQIGGGGGQPTPGNRAPVFAQIGPFNVTAGQNLQFQIFASDPDGDQVFYSAGNLPSGAAFNSSTRTFSWLPTTSQVGSLTIVFRAFDSNGGQAALNVSIVVQPSSQPVPGSRPPVWSQIPSQIITVGQTLQFTVQAFDPDGDVLFYSAPFSLPSGVDFNVTTRVFIWAPSPSQTGSHTVQFRVSDGVNSVDMFVAIAVQSQFFQQIYNPVYQPIYQQPGAYPYGNVALASGLLYGVNQPPVWAQTPDQNISVGQALQFTVFAYDPNGDYLVFQAFNVPSGAVFNQATRTFSWTPVSDSQTGLYQTLFRVSDGINSSDMNVSIRVTSRQLAYLPLLTIPPVYTPPATPAYIPPAPAAPVAKLAEPMPPVKVLPWFWWVIILLLLFILLLLILLWRVYRRRQEVVVI